MLLLSVSCKSPDAARPPAAEPSEKTEAAPEFEVDTPPAVLAVGGAGTLALRIKPLAPWKINVRFPTQVTLGTSRIVRPAAARFANEAGKPDAIHVDAAGISLDVPVKAGSAGAGEIKGRAKFSLCTPESCVPHTRDLTWKVAVQ